MTKTLKTFDTVGFSSFEGVRKIRFANGSEGRKARLEKCGCTDIVLHDLPEAMTKVAAVTHLLNEMEVKSEADRTIAQEWLEKATRVPGPRGRPRKASTEEQAPEAAEPVTETEAEVAQEQEVEAEAPRTDLDDLTPEQKEERKRARDKFRKRMQRAQQKKSIEDAA